jgi:hypothetical protein
VNVPVTQDWHFEADGTCNLNISVTGSASGLIFDSQGATIFNWLGKINYGATTPNNAPPNPSCAVLFQPHTNTADGFAAIYAGRIHIKVAVAGAAGQAGVLCFNAANGNFTQETYVSEEINGSGGGGTANAVNGVLVYGQTVSTGFNQNQVFFNNVHGSSGTGISMCATTGNACTSNQFFIENIAAISAGHTALGVDTWGSNDVWHIGFVSGAAFQYAIKAESTAVQSQFFFGNANGTSTGIFLDNGAGNTFLGNPMPNIGTNGSYGLPGGVQIRFGRVTAAGGAGGSASFATAFPNNCFAIAGSPVNQLTAAQVSCTTTTVTAVVTSGTPIVEYVAIGN